MTDNFFQDLQKEAEAAPKPTASLDAVRAMGEEAVTIEREIVDIEERLSALKTRRYKLLNEQMPSMMDDMRVPFIGVDGYKLDCVSYYKANIASDDPEEKRDAAFSWVEKAGGGDIIANTVMVAFPKEMAEDAAIFAEEVQRRFHNRSNIEVRRERKVPWNRLTSWLKDYVETPADDMGGVKLPVPLDLLNATIGRVVKIKPVRD